MHQRYFLILLLLTITGFAEGITNGDKTVEGSASVRAADSGDNAPRNLKGSTSTNTVTGAEKEERDTFSFISKLAPFGKGNTHAISRNIDVNPTIAKSYQVDQDRGFFNGIKTAFAKLKSFLSEKPSTALKSKPSTAPESKPSTALETNKAGKPKTFLERLKAVEVKGDIKGMVIIYCLFVLITIASGIIYMGILDNTRANVIH